MAFAVILIIILISYLVLGPKDPVVFNEPFDKKLLSEGAETYLKKSEATVPNLREGAQKQIHWAGKKGERTKQVVVYIHGFSASAQEVRPVPDKVAKALNANLYFTRLPGHGRDGDAMGETTAAEWLSRFDETMAIAETLGDEVIIIATSTGATLTTSGMRLVPHQAKIKGIIFLGPNFGIITHIPELANLSGFATWAPWVAGEYREFKVRNQKHGEYWTTRYPLRSIIPMMRLIQHTRKSEYQDKTMPILAIFSNEDRVVSAKATHKFLDRWGGDVVKIHPTLTEEDDAYRHVLAGDTLSPNQTEPTVKAILDWVQTLEN